MRPAIRAALCSESFSTCSRKLTKCRIARGDQTIFIEELLFHVFVHGVSPRISATSLPLHDPPRVPLQVRLYLPEALPTARLPTRRRPQSLRLRGMTSSASNSWLRRPAVS